MVEDESFREGRAGTVAYCADRVTSGGEDAVAAAGASVEGEDEGLGGAVEPSVEELRKWAAAGADVEVEDEDLGGDEEVDGADGYLHYGSWDEGDGSE